MTSAGVKSLWACCCQLSFEFRDRLKLVSALLRDHCDDVPRLRAAAFDNDRLLSQTRLTCSAVARSLTPK